MLAKFELGFVRTLELTGYTVTFHSRCTTAFLFEQLVLGAALKHMQRDNNKMCSWCLLKSYTIPDIHKSLFQIKHLPWATAS